MINQFFILGNPRSGTTVLRLMLNMHSQVVVPPEGGFLLWLYPKYKNWSPKDLNSVSVKAFVDEVLETKKFETWKMTGQEIYSEIIKRNPADFETLAQCVYLAFAHKQRKNPQWIGDKNNYYTAHLDELKQLYSEKSIIHLVRDGRDVALSYKKLKNIPETYKYRPRLPQQVETIAQQWQQTVNQIQDTFHSLENYILLRFEDLVTNPERELSKVLEKLGLDWEKQILDFYKTEKETLKEPQETMAWKQKTRQPLDPSVCGEFKQGLSQEEIESFNSVASQTLKRFGYVT